MKINVLSLFDGCACARVALKRLGVECTYYASEIDKYAIKIAKKNYPDIIELGDVREVKAEMLPEIDLLVGGSPCQDLSGAGKQAGINGSRSSLFFEYVRLLKETKPKYFLFENVQSMKKADRDIITANLWVEPVAIQASLVSAQSRPRLYWTNIPDVLQPEDRKILLKDIIEDGVVERDKSYCIDANYWKGLNNNKGHASSNRQVVFLYRLPHGFIKEDFKTYDKYPTLAAQSPHTKYLLAEKNGFRKLTPIECERLQTLDDNYTEGVSNTQRYKMLGNGFCVEVIKHILSFADFA